MELINGLKYNIQGLKLGLKTPKLLLWGIFRLAMVILLTIASAWIILSYHNEIINTIWVRPESAWILWLWYLLSWLLSLVLIGVSTVISYLVSQILFSVVIMDLMSRITEKNITGNVEESNMPVFKLFIFLIKQEIPRTIIPLIISLLLMLGSLTPLGPVFAILSSIIAAIFLAWDNTDLLPARRLLSFQERLNFLKKSLLFHIGFGLPFLVPLVNILFLSFAPVGATIYHLDKNNADKEAST